MNLDVKVALAPASTYRALAQEGGRIALAPRLGLTALILGTAVAVSATGRVTLGLVSSTALCWSFVVCIQMVAAVLLIRVVPRRRVAMAPALAWLFLGHVPWSIWILAFAARAALTRGGGGITDLFLVTALVPLVWTWIIVAAFCREVLGTSARGATLGTIGHQGLTWSFAFVYAAIMVQAWPRFLKLVAP